MGWIVRFSAKSEVQETELIVSQLWDRDTTGVYETENAELVAGFESETEAAGIASWLRTLDDVGADSVIVEPAATEADWAVNTEAVTHQVVSERHRFSMTITAEATFGHGGHPTTKLALDLLLGSIEPGERVLDLGTGSGVLAIAAAKAGAGPVSAIDIDQTAVSVAAKNAEANGVAVDCSSSTIEELLYSNSQDSLDFQGSRDSQGFDLIVMNVLLPVHRELAPNVLEALAPGGRLITSGYLDEQRSELAALYTAGPGVTIVESAATEGWAANIFAPN